MNDQELKDLVASLAVAQKDTDRQLKETDLQIKETGRQIKETGRQIKETGQQLKETDLQLKDTDRQLKETDFQVKETSRQLKETDLQVKETARQIEETNSRQRETAQQFKETSRLFDELRLSEAKANEELRQSINELKKQLGGLGNKFGDFSEGMAIPSLIEILGKRFGATQIIETKRVRKGEDEIELDLIGASNGDNKTVVAAEVKSVLNQRELEKFIRNLRRFFHFFPQFKGYRLFGVLAAVESSNEMDAASVAQGLCVARMHGDIFRLKVPPDFQPKDFSLA